jgi:hypothetical protein
MDKDSQNPQERQTGKLLLVVVGAVALSLATVVSLVFFYGPETSSVPLKNSLLAPTMLTKLSFTDIDARTQEKTLFMIDRIEYSVREASGWKQYLVGLQAYRQFYELAQKDRPIEAPAAEAALESDVSARLLIRVMPQKDFGMPSYDSPVYMELQFFEEADFYRLRQKESTSWLYFQHAGIQNSANLCFRP